MTLFKDAITWLREHYDEFEFWNERDLAWTVQTRLRRVIRDRRLPYTIFNDYPMLPVHCRYRARTAVRLAAGETSLG